MIEKIKDIAVKALKVGNRTAMVEALKSIQSECPKKWYESERVNRLTDDSLESGTKVDLTTALNEIVVICLMYKEAAPYVE